jgi:hypothetical protein
MINRTKTILLMGILLYSALTQASENIVRATNLGSTMWSELRQGKLADTIVEFREGDELPVTLEAHGDLLESRATSPSYIRVKKNFWLRVDENIVAISLDSKTFKNLRDVLTGSLEVGTGSGQNGGMAEAINIAFKAFLK